MFKFSLKSLILTVTLVALTIGATRMFLIHVSNGPIWELHVTKDENGNEKIEHKLNLSRIDWRLK